MGRTQIHPHYPQCSSCGCDLGGSKYRYTPQPCPTCCVELKLQKERRRNLDRALRSLIIILGPMGLTRPETDMMISDLRGALLVGGK